ncbi:hypothetical protein O0I10_004383 [Lichtheimia ornata]|uniref:DDRGK domain-containing protein 1 n=1 Tax=Lichtheimia ornata TaxID=688661 RepID=A0AAD7V7M2_9FUNG|nr:uncharacterized protein O0I10_004383 [Lichtheimia ornata]KAJ8659790.1 hypothetical protein O0I10_004383 [Lichtheimia ornata]
MAGSNEFSAILLIPIAICVLGILVLLEIRKQQQQRSDDTYSTQAVGDFSEEEDYLDDTIQEDVAEQGEDVGEGSSTAVRVKKIGKKKGEKLRRKEQMRQYHEYMNQQRELRRAQDEILEEEFRRRKAEEAIRRAQEEEKRKKQQAKKAKQEEKERQKREKAEEKELKKKRSRFEKYQGRITDAVKNMRVCTMESLSDVVRLTPEETEEILRELCATSPEFSLSLWSGSTFMFITEKDYGRISAYLLKNGKTPIKQAGSHLISILTSGEEE